VRTRLRWLVAAVASMGIFVLSAWRGSQYGATSWWYVPGYLGLTTAACALLTALRFPRRAAAWALVAGGATAIVGLFWAFVLWAIGAEAYTGAGYGALLLVSLAAGVAALFVVAAVLRGRMHSIITAETLTLTLVLAAAAIEAFAYEDGDGNVVGLTLIFAVVLGFALWRARAEPG
jgi:hypothetical protein